MRLPIINLPSMSFIGSLMALLILPLHSLNAQCVMGCNNDVTVALDDLCQAEVLPDMVLEGTETSNCAGPFEVAIMDANGNILPSSPFVNASHIGMSFTVKITDLASTNNCWGSIIVRDGLAPQLSCDTIVLPCDFSTAPVARPITTGNQSFSITPNRSIGPAAADSNSVGIFADLPTNAVVTDINLVLDISHTASAQLDAYLLNPQGQRIPLARAVCGNSPNWMMVNFDDEAGIPVNAACGGNPALSGTVQPEGSLAAFDGKPAAGLWQILVVDDISGLGGTLNSARLEISYEILAAYQPIVNDACGGVALNFTDDPISGSCLDTFTQIIRRTWTATDASNNSSSCTQLIIQQRPTFEDLILPVSFDGITQDPLRCEEQHLDPGNQIIPRVGWNALPDGTPSPFDEFYPAPNNNIVKWYGTGVPQGGCNEFQFAYSDSRINSCNQGNSNACYKIVRRWIITEWCNGQVFTPTQIIKVADLEAPTISGIANDTTSTDLWRCATDWQVPAPILADNCNTATDLSYSITASEGTPIQDVAGNYILTGLEVGTYTVTYIAEDCCGNSRDSSISLTVLDQTPPVVACDEDTQAALNIDGTTTIFATSFDDGSFDNCGPVFFKVIREAELLGTFNGSTNGQASICDGLNGDDDPTRASTQVYFDDYSRFCCADLGQNIPVVLRVFDRDPGSGPIDPARMEVGGDLYGHFNQCTAFVEVVDKRAPNISCPADVQLNCTQDYTDLSLTGQATASDNCSLDSLFYTDELDLNSCNVGTITRTWMAIDHQGLMAICTQEIRLIDPTTPQFFFPDDMDVSCGESDDPSNTGEPFGIDPDCSLIGISHTDLVFWIGDSCTRKILREWKIIDWCSGTSATDLQVIKEIDDIAPEIIGVPNDTLVDCNAVPAPPVIGTDILASDDCDPSASLQFQESRVDSSCTDQYQLIRSWTATDRCGNQAVAQQVIQVQDTLPPIISGIPMDTTVSCNQIPTPASVTTSDNCDPSPGLSLREDLIAGDCADRFSLRRVWIASDRCGNIDSMIQLLTVIDTIAPFLIGVPADTLVDCDAVPVAPNLMAQDSCDTNPIVTLLETRIDGDCDDRYSLQRTWTATDRCGNSRTATQLISVQDTLAPIISQVPADTTVACDAIPLPPTLMATDNCDPNPIINLQENRINEICPDSYTLQRIWTATDRCGNTSSLIQNLMVIDTLAPVLMNIPPDTTVSCMENQVPMGITATDNCDDNVDITFEVIQPNGPCDGSNQIIRTWTATDNCGNTDVGIQVVTLIDTIAPTITGVPNDTTVDCNAIPMAASPIATDDCTMVQLQLEEQETPGACDDERNIARIWIATDECGNQTRDTQLIAVIDTIPPILTGLPDDLTIECVPERSPTLNRALFTATDNCDPRVSVTTVMDTINRICRNSYTVRTRWTAEDNCGNQTLDSTFVTFIDTIAPSISGVPNDTLVSCDAVPDAPITGTDIMAMDNCDLMPDLIFQADTFNRSCDHEFTIRRLWMAEDNCGNMTIDSQLIMVIDTIAPIISGVPADTTVLCDAVPAVPNLGTDITAADNCTAMPQLSFVADTIRDPNGCESEFTILRIWQATDACNNTSLDSQRITVIDTIPPVIMGVPNDTTIACNQMLPEPIIGTDITSMDNCDNSSTLSFRADTIGGSCASEVTIYRIWRIADKCGNITIDSQVINTIDTIPPVLSNVPADTTADCRDIPAIANVTATDNCDGNLDKPSITETQDGPCEHTYVLTRTWTSTDACGNSSMATQTISVVDTIAPVFVNPPGNIRRNVTTNDSCDIFISILAPATDNCDDNVIITNNSPFATPGNMTGDASGEYPIGTHVVSFVATDACGNSSTHTLQVNVLDRAGPGIECFEALEFELDPITGTFTITPNDIGVAMETCSPPEILSFDATGFPNSVTLTCNTVPDTFITLIAFDQVGIPATCGVFVNVLEPASNPTLCGPNPPPTTANIAGQILTEDLSFLEGVEVSSSGGMNSMQATKAHGYYLLEDLPMHEEYTITPYNNRDPRQGVNTYDLLLISRHILGIEAIGSPYKMIAADINNSGTITTLDMLELRKLLLFVDPEFRNNTSWRYVHREHTFDDPQNPFASAFPEVYRIDELEESMAGFDFVGIKTGDINNSGTLTEWNDLEDRSERSPLWIDVEDQMLEAGEETLVHFTASEAIQLAGLQFTLQLDPAFVELVEIVETASAIDMGVEHFGQQWLSRGILTAGWHSTRLPKVGAGQTLFSLKLRAKLNIALSQTLSMSSAYTTALAFDSAGRPAATHLRFGGDTVTISDKDTFHLYQNRPNPFAESTIIGFYLPEATTATFSLFDVSGRQIKEIRRAYPAGYHELSIRSQELPSPAIYYYQLKTTQFTDTKKMILSKQ